MSSWERLKRLAKETMLNRMPGMITCAQFEEFILDHVVDRLSTKELAVFNRHLRACQACRSYLAAYRRTIETSKQAFAVAAAVPDEMPEDLIAAIVAARPTSGDRPGAISEPSG